MKGSVVVENFKAIITFQVKNRRFDYPESKQWFTAKRRYFSLSNVETRYKLTAKVLAKVKETSTWIIQKVVVKGRGGGNRETISQLNFFQILFPILIFVKVLHWQNPSPSTSNPINFPVQKK